jgi:RNA polymerase sigma-70 factor (ECF subfamily)
MEAKAHQCVHAELDTNLVVAARRDPGQFIVLYDRYAQQIYRYVRMRVHHEQAAEDITSQIFLTALARIGSLRPGSSFAAWLFRVAHNAVLDSYRARSSTSAETGVLEAMPDRDPGPEALALAGESSLALRALIDTLRPEQQHLLALRFGADLSAAEIGAVLDKSPEAVRVALHRTIKELRKRYTHDH